MAPDHSPGSTTGYCGRQAPGSQGPSGMVLWREENIQYTNIHDIVAQLEYSALYGSTDKTNSHVVV